MERLICYYLGNGSFRSPKMVCKSEPHIVAAVILPKISPSSILGSSVHCVRNSCGAVGPWKTTIRPVFDFEDNIVDIAFPDGYSIFFRTITRSSRCLSEHQLVAWAVEYKWYSCQFVIIRDRYGVSDRTICIILIFLISFLCFLLCKTACTISPVLNESYTGRNLTSCYNIV